MRSVNYLLIVILLAASTLVSCVSKSKYDDVVADLIETEMRLENAKARINSLEDTVDNLNADVSRLNGELDFAEFELSRANNLIGQLNIKVSSLEQQLATSESIRREQRATINEQLEEIELLSDTLSGLLNPTNAAQWFVDRYPLSAMYPSNLAIHANYWFNDAYKLGYEFKYDYNKLRKTVRAEYGSKLDRLFDGNRANGEAGGYAYYGTIEYVIERGPNSSTASWYANPNYAFNRTNAHYMLYLAYHEMGHAYFNYKHTFDGVANDGYGDHRDIMGYPNWSDDLALTNRTTTEEMWQLSLDRYFDSSTQRQMTNWIHAKDEDRRVECLIEE